ncbi:hypothetical protein WA556_002049 [Blastocystis sp. ATCC 50177/Nand II]
MGPMVYAAAYWVKRKNEEITKMGFNDSKQLTAEKREHLLGDIQAADSIGYVIRTLSPKEISANMLQTKPFNLNEMSHKAAMDMIRELLRMKVKVTEVYIDTVGDPEKYESKLQAAFSFTTIKFKVSKKADALFKCVSAASIVAKTRRDHIIENHSWEEAYMEGKSFGATGSGYPSDPTTKAFLANCMHPVFGFPTFIRFSWSTIPKLIQEKNGAVVVWKESLEDEDSPHRRPKKKYRKEESRLCKEHSIESCSF